jgi:nucleotide-binding universal stress UspA family protein
MTLDTDLQTATGSTPVAGMTFRHLLLPVDSSATDIAAARYARTVAGRGDSRVTLLHVKSPATQGSELPAESAHALGRARQALGEIDVQTVLITGDAANAITEYAVKNGADLIIMPTRGVGAVRRFVLGSVTAEVLQNAACPVLTFVAEDGAPTVDDPCIRQIACAVDLGPDSLRILHSADAVVRRTGAAMTVMHVNGQLEPMVGVVHDREWCSYLATVLRAEVGKLMREAGIAAEVRLGGGEPARTVAEMASNLKADLLVIGRPRERGLLGRLRAHSYAIISEAQCPVLSV